MSECGSRHFDKGMATPPEPTRPTEGSRHTPGARTPRADVLRTVPPPPVLQSSPKPVPAVELDISRQIKDMHTDLKNHIINESNSIRGELRAVHLESKAQLEDHEKRIEALEKGDTVMSDVGMAQRVWGMQVEIMKQDRKLNNHELTLSNVKVTQIQLKTTMGALKKGNKDFTLPIKETRIVSEGRPDLCVLQFDTKVSASKFKDAWAKKKPTNPDSSLIYVRYAKSKKHREWSKPLEHAATAVRKFLYEQKAEFGEIAVFVNWEDAQVKVYKKLDKKDNKAAIKPSESETAATMCKQTYSISFEPKFAGAQAFL